MPTNTMATRTHSPRDELTITPKPWMLCRAFTIYKEKKEKKKVYKNIWRPSKIHAQHTRSRPGLRIYTLSHLEFFISRKRKTKHTDTLRLFFRALSIFIYTAVIFYFSLLTYVRMNAVIFASVKTPPASQDFRNIARSIRSLEFCFFLFCLWDSTHSENALCRLLDSPIELGRGGPPNKSFRCLCVYQLVTSIRFLF